MNSDALSECVDLLIVDKNKWVGVSDPMLWKCQARSARLLYIFPSALRTLSGVTG